MGMIATLLRVSDQQLEHYRADSRALEDRIYAEDAEPDPCTLNLDKTWDGIIYLLTGASAQHATGALRQVLFSGQLVDATQDFGYGPAHFLRRPQVAYFHEQLSRISTEDLRRRFDPGEMTRAEVYPMIWEEGTPALDYLLGAFVRLRDFYSLAAAHGQAVVSFVS